MDLSFRKEFANVDCAVSLYLNVLNVSDQRVSSLKASNQLTTHG